MKPDAVPRNGRPTFFGPTTKIQHAATTTATANQRGGRAAEDSPSFNSNSAIIGGTNDGPLSSSAPTTELSSLEETLVTSIFNKS